MAVALSLCAGAVRSGEGALDFLAVSSYAKPDHARACVGDSVPPTFCGTISSGALANGVAVGDIDADGDPDVVLPHFDAPAELCLNDGSGFFSCDAIFLAAEHFNKAVLGDFNRDGRMDVILAGSSFRPESQICFNAGGSLLICATLNAIDFGTGGLEAGDVNGDGALDLVTSGDPRVCLNDGTGVFASCDEIVGVPGDGFSNANVALGDLDSDGDLDAVFPTNDVLADGICFGNGSGLFACSPLPGQPLHRDVAIGDVDGDGILDLLFVNITVQGEGHLCPGVGDGSFPSCLPLPQEGSAHAVSLADLDGDGQLEIAFANLVPVVPEPNRLCRFLGYAPPPGGEPQLDCEFLDPGVSANGTDVALWTPWIFQDGFESGDVGRWSAAVQ